MKIPVGCCVNFTEVKQNGDVKIRFKVCNFDIESGNVINLVMFDKFKEKIKTLPDDCKLNFNDMSTLKAYRKKLPFKTLGELKSFIK